jgi:hypothetical protein
VWRRHGASVGQAQALVRLGLAPGLLERLPACTPGGRMGMEVGRQGGYRIRDKLAVIRPGLAAPVIGRQHAMRTGS